jgi:hypothetical protein
MDDLQLDQITNGVVGSDTLRVLADDRISRAHISHQLRMDAALTAYFADVELLKQHILTASEERLASLVPPTPEPEPQLLPLPWLLWPLSSSVPAPMWLILLLALWLGSISGYILWPIIMDDCGLAEWLVAEE